MAPPRRSAPSRTPTKSATPLPKGSRVPQPMLVYWIARSIVIGALILFFASPSILTWAAAHQRAPWPKGQQRGGLLTGLLLNQHDTDTPARAEDGRDQVAP